MVCACWSCRFSTCLTVFQGVSSDIWLVRVVTWRGRRGWAFKALSLLLCGIEVICGITGKFEPCQGGANCWPIRFPVNKKREHMWKSLKASRTNTHAICEGAVFKIKQYIYCPQISHLFLVCWCFSQQDYAHFKTKTNKHLLFRPACI